MSRIAFKTDPEAEAKVGGGGDGKFDPAPRGIYTLQVAEYSEGKRTTTGKNIGSPCTVLTLEIADEGDYFGKRMWLTVTWVPEKKPGHGLALRALSAFGLDYGPLADFNEADFQGRQCRALVEIDDYIKTGTDGRKYVNKKNYVRELYTKNHPEPAELPPPPPPKEAKPVRAAAPAQSDAQEEFIDQDVPF